MSNIIGGIVLLLIVLADIFGLLYVLKLKGILKIPKFEKKPKDEIFEAWINEDTGTSVVIKKRAKDYEINIDLDPGIDKNNSVIFDGTAGGTFYANRITKSMMYDLKKL